MSMFGDALAQTQKGLGIIGEVLFCGVGPSLSHSQPVARHNLVRVGGRALFIRVLAAETDGTRGSSVGELRSGSCDDASIFFRCASDQMGKAHRSTQDQDGQGCLCRAAQLGTDTP
jgi:hypothetical protein